MLYKHILKRVNHKSDASSGKRFISLTHRHRTKHFIRTEHKSSDARKIQFSLSPHVSGFIIPQMKFVPSGFPRYFRGGVLFKSERPESGTTPVNHFRNAVWNEWWYSINNCRVISLHKRLSGADGPTVAQRNRSAAEAKRQTWNHEGRYAS